MCDVCVFLKIQYVVWGKLKLYESVYIINDILKIIIFDIKYFFYGFVYFFKNIFLYIFQNTLYHNRILKKNHF